MLLPRPLLRRARCPRRLPSEPHSRWPHLHTWPRSSCGQHRQSFPKAEDRFPPSLLFSPKREWGELVFSTVSIFQPTTSSSCSVLRLLPSPSLQTQHWCWLYSISQDKASLLALKLPGFSFARGGLFGIRSFLCFHTHTLFFFFLLSHPPEGFGEILPPAPILTSDVANAQPSEFSGQVTSVRK